MEEIQREGLWAEVVRRARERELELADRDEVPLEEVHNVDYHHLHGLVETFEAQLAVEGNPPEWLRPIKILENLRGEPPVVLNKF